MREQDNLAHRRIEREAIAWWQRLREPGQSADVEQQFFIWLQACPAHADAYLRIAAQPPMQQADGDPHAFGLIPSRPVDETVRPRRRRIPVGRSIGVVVALGAVAIAVLLGSRFSVRTPAPEAVHLQSGHGQLRQWQLADGSVIELASESAASVRYSTTERLVQLEAGHGYFHVAKGDRRRFRVLAQGASVVATGTQFDVNLTHHRHRVSLLEGRVVVYADTLALAGQTESDTSAARELSPGDQVTISQGWVSRPTHVDLRQVQAWRKGEIIADGLALADLIDEFNEYADHPIRLTDAALAQTPVSGVFSVYDRDTLLTFLKLSVGAEVRVSRTGEVTVRRSRSGTARMDVER